MSETICIHWLGVAISKHNQPSSQIKTEITQMSNLD